MRKRVTPQKETLEKVNPVANRRLAASVEKNRTQWNKYFNPLVFREMMIRISEGSSLLQECKKVDGQQPVWDLVGEDGKIKRCVVPPAYSWRWLIRKSDQLNKVYNDAKDMWLQVKAEELMELPKTLEGAHPSVIREHGENIRFMLSRLSREVYGNHQEVLHHNQSGPMQINVNYGVVKNTETDKKQVKAEKEKMKVIEGDVAYQEVRVSLDEN